MRSCWIFLSRFDHTFCRSEFWVSYTRSLLSIETFWDDQDQNSFVCSAAEISELVCLYASFLRLEESLSSRSSHRICWLEKSLWSWFSHRLFFSIFNQSALKIWKSSSWVTQKKHDLMTSLFAAFNIESLISYNSQLSIWWLTIDWVTKRSNSSSSLSSKFSLLSVLKSMSCSRERRLIRRERRRIIFSHWWNNRDRNEYIRLRKSSRFSIISLHIHNTQRSIRSNSNL